MAIQCYLNDTLATTYLLVFTNLPVIELKAARIINEPKLAGTFHLMSGEFKQDTGVLNMGIEYRGVTAQQYPKKPYAVEIGTADDWRKDLDVQLLDLYKNSDWILDAAYRDQTFVRNIISHDIFRDLRSYAYVNSNGEGKGQAAVRGRLVEVLENESYQGLFVLEEQPGRKLYGLQKISVPTSADGIAQWSQVDFSNPDNGSVLYKATKGEKVFYDTASVMRNFEQAYPDNDDVTRWDPLIEFADFVANSSDEDFINGIESRIDLDSVVDWALLIASSHGTDNLKKNFFLLKNAGGRFYLATWDHDASFGMLWNGGIDPLNGITVEENNLLRRLLALPATGFNTRVKARWRSLRDSVFNEVNVVNRFQTYLNDVNKGALGRNKARWPESGGEGANTPRLGSLDFINHYVDTMYPILDQVIEQLPEQ